MKYIVALFLVTLTAYAQSDAALRSQTATLWAGRNILQNTNIVGMTNGQILMMVGTNIVATNVPSADLSTVVAKAGDTMTGELEVPALTVTGTGAYATMIVTNMTLLTPLAGTPFDLRIAGAGTEPVTNNTDVGAVATFKGSARTALEAAIAAGTNNIFLPAGRWNFYQGVDHSTYADQGITVSTNLTIQGVPGQTILDFGRQGGANSDRQVEFIHMGGTLEFRDLTLLNYSYLVAQKFAGRSVNAHGKVKMVNCTGSGGQLIGAMWTPNGPPRLAWDGSAWTWGNSVADIFRTNILSGRTWTTDAGWTDEGGGKWSYVQPAAFANVTNVARTSGGLVTAICDTAHGLNVGDWITIDVSNNSFDEATPTYVWSTPTSLSFTYYQNSAVAVSATTVTGTASRMGALKLTHPFTFRPGDLQRMRFGLDSKTAGTGPRLYVGGTLSQPINRAKTHKITGIQRTTSGTPRYTQITVDGAHDFKPGDVIDVEGTATEYWNTTLFTVVRYGTGTQVLCSPDPGAGPAADTTSTNMTAAYYEFPLSGAMGRVSVIGAYKTTFTNATPHLLTPQMLVSFEFDAPTPGSFNGGLHRILTVSTSTNFTYDDYRPGFASYYTNSGAIGKVIQTYGETPIYPLGYDNKVELVPSPDFVGTVDVGELWTACWVDVELSNCYFEAPAAFSTNGRSGMTVNWAFRNWLIDNCTFTGGDQWVYGGKSDSDTVFWEPAAYANGPRITRSLFTGIGLTPGLDTRGAYLFGSGVSISDSRFEGVGYGTGISKKGNRDALYIAADSATIERTTFRRSGGSYMVTVKGDYDTIDRSYGISGAPVARAITFRECVFDGLGGGNVSPFYLDGSATRLQIENCEIRDFASADSVILGASGSRYSDIRLLNSSVRNMPLVTATVKTGVAEMIRIVCNGNEFVLSGVTRLVSAYSPFSVEVIGNVLDNGWNFTRANPAIELVYLANVVSGVGIGSVNVSNNRITGTTSGNLFSAYVTLPTAGGTTVTNIMLLNNNVGATSVLVANEATNTVMRLTAIGNYDANTIVQRTDGIYGRTNRVETLLFP